MRVRQAQSRLTEGLVSFRIKTLHASPLLEIFERSIRHAAILAVAGRNACRRH
jgi:hypothetical protein